MEIFVLIGLIIINGLFAMSEIALVTARRARLKKLGEEGDVAALAAVELSKDPNRFLSTIQIGNHIDWGTERNYRRGRSRRTAQPVAWHAGPGAKGKFISRDGFGGGRHHLFFNRVRRTRAQAPGSTKPRRDCPIYGPADVFTRHVVEAVRRVAFGIHQDRAARPRRERINQLRGDRREIHEMLKEGSESGIIERQEHQMVRNVFRLDDRQIASLMVPRSGIVYLDVDRETGENLERIQQSEHSRFPVCRGGLRNILGIISARQLLAQTIKARSRI